MRKINSAASSQQTELVFPFISHHIQIKTKAVCEYVTDKVNHQVHVERVQNNDCLAPVPIDVDTGYSHPGKDNEETIKLKVYKLVSNIFKVEALLFCATMQIANVKKE